MQFSGCPNTLIYLHFITIDIYMWHCHLYTLANNGETEGSLRL